MKAILVDDEPVMIDSFVRLSKGIGDLQLSATFESGAQALDYASANIVDLAFLDIAMPVMDGIELAKRLRAIRMDILIVFVSAYDGYVREFNQLGGDYYIVKPYNRQTLEMMMSRIRLIARRQRKELYMQMFGRFNIFRNGIPIPIRGKAKEILALVATRRGREISNEEIFSTVWETRPYSNDNMTVYYNALRRLKSFLYSEGLGELLISTAHGQMINTAMFDCDYYAWLDKSTNSFERFEGEFLTEYSWGEYILADILWKELDG